MSNPNQMYLFNYMEYDDYESNDWEDVLFSDSDFQLDSDTDELSTIVNNESDIKFYDEYRDAMIRYETEAYAQYIKENK